MEALPTLRVRKVTVATKTSAGVPNKLPLPCTLITPVELLYDVKGLLFCVKWLPVLLIDVTSSKFAGKRRSALT